MWAGRSSSRRAAAATVAAVVAMPAQRDSAICSRSSTCGVAMLLAVVTASLVLAACGGSTATTGPASSPGPGSTASAAAASAGTSSVRDRPVRRRCLLGAHQGRGRGCHVSAGPGQVRQHRHPEGPDNGTAVVCQYLVVFGVTEHRGRRRLAHGRDRVRDSDDGVAARGSVALPAIGSEAFLAEPAPGLYEVWVTGPHGKFRAARSRRTLQSPSTTLPRGLGSRRRAARGGRTRICRATRDPGRGVRGRGLGGLAIGPAGDHHHGPPREGPSARGRPPRHGRPPRRGRPRGRAPLNTADIVGATHAEPRRSSAVRRACGRPFRADVPPRGTMRGPARVSGQVSPRGAVEPRRLRSRAPGPSRAPGFPDSALPGGI